MRQKLRFTTWAFILMILGSGLGGLACSGGDDCPGDQVCAFQKFGEFGPDECLCVEPECNEDDDCDAGFICDGGFCVESN